MLAGILPLQVPLLDQAEPVHDLVFGLGDPVVEGSGLATNFAGFVELLSHRMRV